MCGHQPYVAWRDSKGVRCVLISLAPRFQCTYLVGGKNRIESTSDASEFEPRSDNLKRRVGKCD
jgi:hypothetical protein